MAGQDTLREQMANAAAAWARERPLQHNRRTAQPPTLAVSVEEVQPDIEAAEVAAVHVTLWVASPYFEAEVVDLEIGFPTTVSRLSEALKDSCSVMPDYATDFICTTPQLGRDFASFVAIPSWVRETSKTAVVIDSTAIGGGTFAAYVNDVITKENVLMCLVLEQPEGLMAYAFGSDRPMQSRQVYPRVQGGVIKIVRSGMVPQWQDELVQRLHEPRKWNPAAALPDPVGRLHTVYQSADDQVVEEIFSDDERPLEVSAEEALNYEHGEVWVRMPEDRIQHLSHLGRRVWGQVAVFDGVEQMAQDSVVIFLDLRGVAHFPQWAQIEGECFCPVSYFNDLQIGQPDGWRLMVRGGDPVVDGDNIRVHNGEVLELFLARDPPELEDPMDTDGESGSDEDDDGDCCDAQHPLPDSIFFSPRGTPHREGHQEARHPLNQSTGLAAGHQGDTQQKKSRYRPSALPPISPKNSLTSQWWLCGSLIPCCYE